MQTIIEKNYNCLDMLGLSHETISSFLLKELNGYEFVLDEDNLQEGKHIRWILLEEPSNISRGAIFCCKKKTKQNIPVLVCKNYGTRSIFYLHPEKYFFFDNKKLFWKEIAA